MILWAGLFVARPATIFDRGSTWNYFIGTEEASSPISLWRQIPFNDGGWASGPAPIGYGEGEIVTTVPGSGSGGWVSIFFRKSFVIAEPTASTELELSIRIDDGCIAWINGFEVGRFNVPAGELAYNAVSSTTGEPTDTVFTIPNAASILVPGTNVVAIQAFNRDTGSSDLVMDAALFSTVDDVPPVVLALNPPPLALVRNLFEIEVTFSEAVGNVDPEDLLINGVPAEDVMFGAPGQAVFSFPEPPTGTVQVAWAAVTGITDLSPNANAFAGGPGWTYTLDPNAEPPGLIISEFMASNDNTLNDEDGDSSDWIELFNSGLTTANLGGWYLTDAATDLTKWRLPSVTLLPNAYLVVFASGKDRASSLSPLHTSFQLSGNGEYLALVDPGGNVISEYAPDYPEQSTDVSYGRDRANPFLLGYFVDPTPGAQNTPSGAGFAPPVEFSSASRTFTSPFSLTLSNASPNAVIRYTLDGSLPSAASPIYSAPLTIDRTLEVRTRAFEVGLLPGPPRSEHFIRLDASVQSVTSDLPIMILHNYGGGSVPASGEQFVVMQIFDRQGARSALAGTADLSTRGRFRLRGSSTQGIAKGSFAFEAWDDFNDDKDIAPLGMPPESDWVLYAPNQFDPVLIHNSFMYELSNDVGRYASRTRFVEVYLKDDSGTPGSITSSDYNGIYLIIEKVKRDNNRVDIDNLEPEHLQAPEVTGGYLLKIDRPDPGDGGFGAAGQTILYVDPKEPEIETPQRDPQEQYIRGFMNAFGTALNGSNFADPDVGYAAYVDVPSLLDHHILNVLSENADAFRLSTYFYKPRNGKLEYGPIWDFDRSLESKADNRDDNPSVWHDGGTDFFNYTWWGRMLQDTNFWQGWVDRWQELQDGPMSIQAMHAKIDRMANELREAQVREQNRWASITGPRGTYQDEVNIMRNWLAARVNFINSEFLERPVFSREGGDVAPGENVSLFAPEGGALYYTIDGTDPRNPDGTPSGAARVYDGSPITIGSNVRIVARAMDPSHANMTGGDNPRVSTPWSGRRAVSFIVAAQPLVITEIMYHPLPPSGGSLYTDEDFEYLELKNTGAANLSLARFRLVNGVTFDFTGGRVPVLLPGETVLVVRNEAAFTSRYGTGFRIAGEYVGALDNNGERIELIGPAEESVLDFSYNDAWYPITDGLGASLQIVNPEGAPGAWDRKSGWRPSQALGGSPGADDAPPPGFPAVRVNEALTHTDLPQIDAVELHNPTAATADLGGWFLTDDLAQPAKYVFPPGTLLGAGGYLVVYETNFNANPGLPGSFLLSSKGEGIYLLSGNGAQWTGYLDGFEFGAAANGVSFGRHLDSQGRIHYPAQSALTLGGPNAGPRVGPVVVSEIMYHPANPPPPLDEATTEFVELSNVSGAPVPLYDVMFPTNRWRLRGAVDFDVPLNTTLPAGGRLLVVGFDPVTAPATLTAFRSRYGIDGSVTILGPFDGRLNNAGDAVRLYRPDTPEPPPAPAAGEVPFILVEEVAYGDASPWPLAADGLGLSLQRVNELAFGNDPASWRAAPPTAGSAGAGGQAPVISVHPVGRGVVAGETVMFAVGASGSGPLQYQWRFNGANIFAATNSTHTLTNVQSGQAGGYQVVVLNAAGATDSLVAALQVAAPATIRQQPASVVVNPGANVTFTIDATSNTPISYQWRKDGVPIPGATNPSLTIFNAQLEDDALYDVVVTDGIGSVVSAPALLGIYRPVEVVQPPVSQTVAEGSRVVLSIETTGLRPISYRWRRNFSTIDLQNIYSYQSFLVIESAQLSDMGSYTVALTNLALPQPGILSAAGTLTVLPDTDGDGIEDEWEEANDLNPLSLVDGDMDADGDGMTNREERIANTDPQDPSSYLRITGLDLDGGVDVVFEAAPNTTYSVEYSDMVEALFWQKLGDVTAGPTNRVVSMPDPGATAQRYYRLVTPRR